MSVASVYFRNALATVTYHSRGYVCLTWSDVPITDENLRALYTHTLHALTHHRTGKLLTDQRRRQPLPAAAQQWIIQEWIPTAVRTANYTHCAIVEGIVPAASAAARHVGHALRTPLAFRYFSEPEAAARWLAEPETGQQLTAPEAASPA